SDAGMVLSLGGNVSFSFFSSFFSSLAGSSTMTLMESPLMAGIGPRAGPLGRGRGSSVLARNTVGRGRKSIGRTAAVFAGARGWPSGALLAAGEAVAVSLTAGALL